jgi:hypothetical protein
MMMACPYFRVSAMHCHCGAVEVETIPCLHDRERFCRHRWYFERCDVYRRRRALGRKLTEHEWAHVLFEG